MSRAPDRAPRRLPVPGALLGVALCLALLPTGGPARATTSAAPLLFAAASLTDVLTEIAASYREARGADIRLSFGGSSQLARQIEAGAPADAFFSADEEWMDYLAARGLIDVASRIDLVANRLVLIAPRDSRVALTLVPGVSLTAALGDGRLALADPEVPAGRYARAALSSLGAWQGVANRLARAENVRAALAFVARGETSLGIVYETDARLEPRVRVVAVFPADSHPPIRYPFALVAGRSAAAADFAAWLRGPSARAAFERAGFTPLPVPSMPKGR
jgi:molybdate transport system substrate-binding protein